MILFVLNVVYMSLAVLSL